MKQAPEYRELLLNGWASPVWKAAAEGVRVLDKEAHKRWEEMRCDAMEKWRGDAIRYAATIELTFIGARSKCSIAPLTSSTLELLRRAGVIRNLMPETLTSFSASARRGPITRTEIRITPKATAKRVPVAIPRPRPKPPVYESLYLFHASSSTPSITVA